MLLHLSLQSKLTESLLHPLSNVSGARSVIGTHRELQEVRAADLISREELSASNFIVGCLWSARARSMINRFRRHLHPSLEPRSRVHSYRYEIEVAEYLQHSDNVYI